MAKVIIIITAAPLTRCFSSPTGGHGFFLVVIGFLGNQHTSEHTADLESQADGNSHWMTSKVEPKQPGFVVEHHFASADSRGRPHSVCIWF